MKGRSSGVRRCLHVVLAAVLVGCGAGAAITSCNLMGNEPPEMPSRFRADAISSTEIELTWRDNSDNETGFRIKFGTSEENLRSSKSVDEDEEEYVLDGLQPDTTYYFCIRAEGEAADSEYCDVESATTLPADDGGDPGGDDGGDDGGSGGDDGGGGTGDTSAPSKPTGLTATAASSSQIDLSWTASTDNVGVTGYKIYRDGSYLEQVSGTTASDDGLEADTTYSYTVSAVDAAGNESSQSDSDSATTEPEPTGVIFEEGFEDMSDDWSATSGFASAYSGYGTSTPGVLGTEKCYVLDGGPDSGKECLYHNFAASQASHFTIYAAAGNSTSWGGCVTLTFSGGASCWMMWAAGNFASSDGGDPFIGPAYVDMTWYKIEFRDINWTAYNYDLYINDTAVAYNLGFVDGSSATEMTQIQLYNSDSSALFYFDEILLE